MTVNELLSEVSALGYDGALECDEAFLCALERSKRQLFSERRVVGTLVIPSRVTKPLGRIPIYRHPSGERAIFPLSGVCYSFFVSGEGRYTVVDGDDKFTRSFNAARERHKGFLSSGGSIIFEGQFAFTVTDLVCFGSRFSDNVEDIPDGGSKRLLDMTELVGDFHSFVSYPTDSQGKRLPEVTLDGECISIPADFKEDVYIVYKRTPKRSFAEAPDAQIDLPTGCEHLLALLVASYVYVDSSPELAELYGKRYREAAEEEKKSRVSVPDTSYRDTDGWA